MSKFAFEKILNKANIPAYLLSLPHLNSVSAAVVVKVGTVDEIWPQEAGIAHAFEHLVLRGTQKFPSAYLLSSYIEGIGGFKGATTDYEKTIYYGRVPSQYAERLIEVLAEIVNSYLIPKNSISKEIQVIQEEKKRKYDSPLKVLNFRARSFLFGSHPLGREIVGEEESLNKLTQSDFLTFASKYYHPSNFTIILIGNIKTKEAIEFIDKYFTSGIEKLPNERPNIPLIDNKKRELKFYHTVKQAQVELVAPFSFIQERDIIALKLFREMISGGVGAPLFQEIREKRGLAYSISTYISDYSIGSFHVQVGTKANACDKVISLIFKVIKDNKNSNTLLRQTKKRIKGNLLLSLDDSMSFLLRSAQEAIRYGKPKSYQEFIKEIERITIKDIERIVNKFLQPNNFRRIIMLPK